MEEPLGQQLAFAAKAARASFDQALSRIGSSLCTFLVLRHVELYPGLSQRQLAGRLGIEGPTLTHHLDRLVTDGLIKRVRGREDRRTSSTVLTAKGEAHLRQVVDFADRLDAELQALFTTSELQTLQACLQRITDHFEGSSVDDHRSRAG
jgi:MarR family transcriptional regulator for hemolysin